MWHTHKIQQRIFTDKYTYIFAQHNIYISIWCTHENGMLPDSLPAVTNICTAPCWELLSAGWQSSCFLFIPLGVCLLPFRMPFTVNDDGADLKVPVRKSSSTSLYTYANSKLLATLHSSFHLRRQYWPVIQCCWKLVNIFSCDWFYQCLMCRTANINHKLCVCHKAQPLERVSLVISCGPHFLIKCPCLSVILHVSSQSVLIGVVHFMSFQFLC